MDLDLIRLDFCSPSIEEPLSVSVAWDGKRTVIIGQSQIDLDDLASEVIRKSRPSEVDTLSMDQRVKAIRLVDKIQGAYRSTDQQIRTKNIFTRALYWIRDCFVRGKLAETRHSFRGFSMQSLAKIQKDLFGEDSSSFSDFGTIYMSDKDLEAFTRISTGSR